MSYSGEMAKQLKDPDLLSGLIEVATKALENGDPGGFLTEQLFESEFDTILSGCIGFDAAVPDLERDRIMSKVALEVRQSRTFTPSQIVAMCSKLEAEYLAKPAQSYRLLTEISLGEQINISRAVVNDVVITFRPKLGKAFAIRADHARVSKSTTGFELPPHYMRLAATVSAKSPAEASSRALDAVDLLRAAWNLSLNRSKTWRHSTGAPSPVNDIRLSPLYTVHDMKGELATQTYWYDTAYRKPAKNFDDPAKFGNLTQFAASVRGHLRRCAYRQDLESAMLRYVRTLDASDMSDALLRLWGLLEYLTDCVSKPAKNAIQRASFLFSDPARSRLLLSHIASCRNRYVHAGSEVEEAESLLFHLKRYVDQLFFFHLGNRYGFATRAEAAAFMDLPHDTSVLKGRIQRFQQAVEYLTPAKASPDTKKTDT